MTTQTENLEVPKHNEGLLDKYTQGGTGVNENKLSPEKIEKDKSLLDKLPNPTGWRMLVLPHAGVKKTKGGILLADSTLETIQMTTVCAYVLKQGDLCYKDKEKFPNGPWCQAGDWVIFGRYAGARFKIEGGEVRILNDDEIIARVDDPNDILQTY
jgi:co-chaperonin GroES (HSP10)